QRPDREAEFHRAQPHGALRKRLPPQRAVNRPIALTHSGGRQEIRGGVHFSSGGIQAIGAVILDPFPIEGSEATLSWPAHIAASGRTTDVENIRELPVSEERMVGPHACC